jgi:hypothetical protein
VAPPPAETGSGLGGAAVVFVVAFLVLAGVSGQRFTRQSAAPHFVYQAKSWLDGRLDIDPKVLPNNEDWACVRNVNGVKVRCFGPLQKGDTWYVSFPPFPAAVMMPFVAIHSYQFNDTSFGVAVGALALAAFYWVLRAFRRLGETDRSERDNQLWALLLGFGTLFFYCAIRGEVWFSAEVMGVGFTSLYVLFSVQARRPVLAGLFFSMAVLTRTPLLFSGVFFVMEVFLPGNGDRWNQLAQWREGLAEKGKKLGLFTLGALPLASLAAAYNQLRFGHVSEFGHKFLYNNRVNVDIDKTGLFDLSYLSRNLDAAFFKAPTYVGNKLGYDPHGLSLALTFPLLFLLLQPKAKPRLYAPLWVTVLACALPGLLYQNDGYMQFGFRFSLDYTPYLMMLIVVTGASLKSRWTWALALLGLAVNAWGALAFRGYTEYVRGW